MRSPRAVAAARRDDLTRDDGFTLIEAVVALVVVALVTTALAASVVSGVRASLISRQNQQAADFMTRALEVARQKDFSSLGLLASDLSSDAGGRIASCSLGSCVNPGTGVPEKVFVTTGAAFAQHRVPTASNGTGFVVYTYVTQIAGQDPSELKRVTVFTTWQAFGRTHSRSISSLVTAAQRGLPLPKYQFTTSQPSVAASPGATLQFPLRLLNQGAPDRWNLTMTGTAATWAWRLYSDVNTDGLYTSGTDTLLTDTNSDGIVDTGRLDPVTDFPILAVYPSAATDPTGTRTLTVTATSVAQPAATGAIKSLNLGVTLSTTVVPTPTPTPTTTATPTPTPTPTSTASTPASADCTWSAAVPTVVVPTTSGNGNAYTNTRYSLHNGTAGSVASTTAQSSSSMDTNAATTQALAAMSTDINALGGRTVNPATAATSTAALALADPRQFLDWKVSTGNQTKDIGGTAVLKLWVGPTTGSLANVPLRVVVYKGLAASATSVGSWSGSVITSCSGWQLFYVAVPLTSSTVAKNTQYGVRVVNTGTQAVRFAYNGVASPASGTAGYDATFGLGVR